MSGPMKDESRPASDAPLLEQGRRRTVRLVGELHRHRAELGETPGREMVGRAIDAAARVLAELDKAVAAAGQRGRDLSDVVNER
jgi:hypothetical protein